MNAIVHIYDGGPPPAHDGDGGRNTLLGFGIHSAASVWWASFYELALAAQARPRPVTTAGALAAIAYVVDYYVVSKRFRPGFETCLPASAMFAVYAALAAGFAASGAHLGRHRRTRVAQRQNQRKGAAFARDARQPELPAQKPRQLAADR